MAHTSITYRGLGARYFNLCPPLLKYEFIAKFGAARKIVLIDTRFRLN